MSESSISSAGIVIRRVEDSEKDSLKALRLRALSTDRMSFASTFEKESKFEDQQWETLTRRAAKSAEMVVLVAQPRGGPMVGMVGSFREGNVTHVWGMWVEPEYRRLGLGGRLLDAILSQIDASDPANEVKLGVVSSSEGARRLYVSRGFEETGHTEPLEHSPTVIWYEMVRRSSK